MIGDARVLAQLRKVQYRSIPRAEAIVFTGRAPFE